LAHPLKGCTSSTAKAHAVPVAIDEPLIPKQHYKSKLELRGQVSDHTSMLHLTFLTLETTTLKEKIVGFSVFPIFINSVTKMPVL
jgi:hypothetical protein